MLPHVFSGFPYVERFYSYTQLPSTNEKAIHSSEIPEKGVFVFQADSRIKEVVHSGRDPYIETDGCLWVSILQPQPDLTVRFLYTRALSLAIISSIKHFFPDAPVFLKWPDCIVWNSKNICTIQTEQHHTSSSLLVTGFGLNVNFTHDKIPAHLQSVTTSVYIETGRKIPLSTLLRKIMESYKGFIEKSPQECHTHYCTFLSLQNARISINGNVGIFKTVTVDGQAVIETDSGTKQIDSGTIQSGEDA